jgi:hypothetical protein
MNHKHPTLSDIDAWAKASRPVFIGGMERSGTSMMLRSISYHQAFYSINRITETYIFPSIILPPLPIAIDKEAVEYMGGWETAEQWMDHANYLLKDDDLSLITANNQIFVTSSKACIVKPSPKAMKAIIITFFYTIHRLNHGIRIVEKSPTNAFHLTTIFDYFPMSQFVGMIRNPLEVVASNRRRYRKQKEMGYKDDELVKLTQSAEWYVKRCNWIRNTFRLAEQRWPENIILCNYHEVTHNPKKAMQKIATRLGVPFHKSLLGKDLDASGWDPLISKRIQPNDYDIYEYLSEQEIEYIKEHADYEF